MTKPPTTAPTPEKLDDVSLEFLDATPTVEDRAFGSVYPVLQWLNGQVTRKNEGGIGFTGGFFVSSEQGIEVPGFEPYTMITNNGDEVLGFAARDVVMAIIRYRRSWKVVMKGETLARRYAFNEYEEANELGGTVRGQSHILVAIKGVTEPVVLVCSGHVSKRLLSSGQGKDRGIIPSFASKVVNHATRIATQRGKKVTYPLCAFELTIGPNRDDKGLPVFEDVGKEQKSKVTLPKWLDEPKTVEVSEVARRFVGNARFAALQQFHRDADDWVAQWSAEALESARARFNKDKKTVEPVAAEGAETGVPGDGETPF